MLTIDLEILVMGCSILVGLGGACGVIYKALKPVRDVLQRIDELSERSARDYKRLQSIESRLDAIGKATWAHLAHTAQGNHTGEMARALEELSVSLMGFGDIRDDKKG